MGVASAQTYAFGWGSWPKIAIFSWSVGCHGVGCWQSFYFSYYMNFSTGFGWMGLSKSILILSKFIFRRFLMDTNKFTLQIII